MSSRREFITLLSGAAAAWPLAARAQQTERLRHIAVFLGLAENNPATISGVQHLRDALAALGWTDGKNVRVTYRYADGNPTRARALAKEIAHHSGVRTRRASCRLYLCRSLIQLRTGL
jgi:putative ABC transport system substrate-binding protein